jgi:hypothetical protein
MSSPDEEDEEEDEEPVGGMIATRDERDLYD